MAAGNGSTFDGLAPTNGYHPLWLAILVPIYAVWQTPLWIPIYVAQSVNVLFDLLTGLVLYRTIAQAGLAREALAVSALWFLTPQTALLGLRGMEASVSCLVIVLLAAHLTRVSRAAGPPNLRSAALAGVLLGLAGLARTDNLVVLGIAVTLFAIAFLRERAPSLAPLSAWWATVAATSALVAVPWLLWNYSQFGSVIQTSGQMKLQNPGVYGALHWDWSGLRGIVKSIWGIELTPLFWPTRYLAGEEFRDPRLTHVVVWGLVGCLFASVLAAGRTLYERVRAARLLALPGFAVLYLALHTLLYAGWWRIYASWYALPYCAFWVVVQGMLLGALFSGAPAIRPAIRTALVGCLVALHAGLAVAFVLTIPHRPRGPEHEFGPILARLREEFPDGAVVGAFNAGRLGYVARGYPSLRVTNLDGLVNNEVYDALHRRAYRSYVVDRVDALAEDPRLARMFLAPAEVDSFDTCFVRLPESEIWRNAAKPRPR